ncbi:hypothetical protein OIU13_06395 [Brevundimonas sp. BT-123]|nr:hypothetical protein [Brevundimonas sp. BT-123]MCW0046165.1 hypothetical protein [Brevundimonas sp. BT-123]
MTATAVNCFRQRAQAELHIAIVGDVPFAIGQAVAPIQKDATVAGDQDGAGKGVGVAGRTDHLVHARHVLGGGRAAGQRAEREGQGAGGQQQERRATAGEGRLRQGAIS